MRAEYIVGAVVRALIEEILVLGGQLRPEGLGVATTAFYAEMVYDLYLIREKFASFDDTRLEDPFRVRLIRLVCQAFAAPLEDAHGRRIG
jgi:hypothetical protein